MSCLMCLSGHGALVAFVLVSLDSAHRFCGFFTVRNSELLPGL